MTEQLQIKRFKALAEENRLRIFKLLARSPEPLNVSTIAETLGMRNALVSHHLGKLSEADLILGLPLGQFMLYRVDPGVFDALIHDIVVLRKEMTNASERTNNRPSEGTGVWSPGIGENGTSNDTGAKTTTP